MINNKLQCALVCAAFSLLPFLGSAQKTSERFFESGSKSMSVTYKNNLPVNLSMIFPTPQSNDDSMIVVEGVLETTETPHQYILRVDNSENEWLVYETDNTLRLECTEGACYDKKGTYNLWKEPFRLVD